MPAAEVPNGISNDHQSLLRTIDNSLYDFLLPPLHLHAETLGAVKHLLDPLAAEIADVQRLRRDENRKKRKRGDTTDGKNILQLRQVYTKGLGVAQVWEQARRILDASYSEIERGIEEHAASTAKDGMRSDQVFSPYDSDGKLDSGSDGELSSLAAADSDEDIIEDDNGVDEGDEDDMALQEDGLEEDADEQEDLGASVEDVNLSDDDQLQDKTYVQDPNGLNDGFFSIDDFNKQSQFLEEQDVRGDGDNRSDEDEIDWDADPMTTAIAQSTRMPKLQETNGAMESDDEDDDEAGPTFGNADLNAASSEDEDLDDAMPGLNNTNEVRYADFFEPPPKKPSKTKRMRALPKTQPPSQQPSQKVDETDNALETAMADVRRDLLDSDEELSDEDSGSDEESKIATNKNLSTHEKQRAQIAAEIRRLEAENVAKKDWTLSGEARAADRPVNSLIEEDLEFERVGKPVPVITTEVSEEIEQLIKRRILAKDFDEVVRRLPDAIGAAAESRRGRVEVDDNKPQSGLAEVYEQEHLKATDPAYLDKRSAATKKQHEEIDRLWKEVSTQLDLLSNLHFKPKRVEVQMKTVEDKPTISMEDARPVGVGGEDSMLAPQEIYKPGSGNRANDEVVKKSGASISKEELTREEKTRRRRREKERAKKAGLNQPLGKQRIGDKQGKKSKGEEKQDILDELRKGNVKVISKKGELQDLGKQRRGHTDERTSSSLKL